MFPKDLSGASLQAFEHGEHRKNIKAAVMNDGSGARTPQLSRIKEPVWRSGVMCREPNPFTGPSIQTRGSFMSERLLGCEVSEVEPSVFDHRGVIAEADGDFPF